MDLSAPSAPFAKPPNAAKAVGTRIGLRLRLRRFELSPSRGEVRARGRGVLGGAHGTVLPVTASIPTRLRPPQVSSEKLAALVCIAEQIEERDAQAVVDFLAQTGRLLGWMDVRGAAAGNGVKALVESCLQPEPADCSDLTEDEMEEMVQAISSAELSAAQTDYALDLLRLALDQEYLTDLIFWPAREYSSKEILQIARDNKGKALSPYLDPTCTPEDPGRVSVSSPDSLAPVRSILAEMVAAEEIDLSSGEVAIGLAQALGSIDSGSKLADWLCDANGISEVFADDDLLTERLAQMKSLGG